MNVMQTRNALLIALSLTMGLGFSAFQAAAEQHTSTMLRALDKELGNTLTPAEIKMIEKAEAELQSNTKTFHPSFISELNRLNFLVCVSGRAATVAKGRIGVCSNPTGRIYRLLGYGMGLSAGAQLSIFGVTVVTQAPNSSIAGDYGGATSMSQSGLGFLVQNMFGSNAWRMQINALLRFMLVFGGPEFAVAQSPDAYMVMAGVGLGPMLDLGMERFKLAEMPSGEANQ